MLNFLRERMWMSAVSRPVLKRMGLPGYKEDVEGYTLQGVLIFVFNVGNLQDVWPEQGCY